MTDDGSDSKNSKYPLCARAGKEIVEIFLPARVRETFRKNSVTSVICHS